MAFPLLGWEARCKHIEVTQLASMTAPRVQSGPATMTPTCVGYMHLPMLSNIGKATMEYLQNRKPAPIMIMTQISIVPFWKQVLNLFLMEK